MPIATLTLNVDNKETTVHIPVQLKKQWRVEFIKDYDDADQYGTEFNIPPGTERILEQDPSEGGFRETMYTGHDYFVARKYYKITGFREIYSVENNRNRIDLNELLAKL